MPSLFTSLHIVNFDRAALRYAVHDSLVTAAFSGLFLLKMANLFPTDLDLGAIVGQVDQLAQLLSDVAAERWVCYFPIATSSYMVTLTLDMPSPSVLCWLTCVAKLVWQM